MTTTIPLAQVSTTSTDPWQPYDDAAASKHGGGHHGHPVVPESSTYGLIFAGLCVILLLWAKRRAAKRLGITCGCGHCK